MGFSLYHDLDLQPKCSEKEVKKRYRELAKKHHPDKGGNKETFQKITKAHEVLSDPDKKKRYDQLGDAMFEEGHGGMPQGFGGFGGFGFGGFDQFFNFTNVRQNNTRKKSKPIDHKFVLSQEDAYSGVMKKIKITSMSPCSKCIGICPKCKGVGNIQSQRMIGPIVQMVNTPCSLCTGIGSVKNTISSTCCNERGYTQKTNIVQVSIPKGVTHGEKIVFRGQGNETIGMDRGDVVIHIEVVQLENHSGIVRNIRGGDLVYTIPIDLETSIIGEDFVLPHPSGVPLCVTTRDSDHYTRIEHGVVIPNKEYRVPNKGMPVKGKDDACGNAIVLFKINYDKYKKVNMTKEHRNEIVQILSQYKST